MLDWGTKRFGASIMSDLYREADRSRTTTHDYTIRDLARRYGVTLRTLRFYEDKSILKPRRIGQNRLYSDRDIDALELALFGKRAGLTLREIRELLDLSNLKEGRRPQPLKAKERLDAQRKALTEERQMLDEAIEEICSALDALGAAAKVAQRVA